MSTLSLGLQLSAGDTYRTSTQLSAGPGAVIAAVRPSSFRESWTIQATETDALRALAAALIRAADEAEALYRETYEAGA